MNCAQRNNRTRNLAYLGDSQRTSLVATLGPHYLARESLVAHARIMVDDSTASGLIRKSDRQQES